ncbi:Mfa1 family fimbria major subunit [uncultured Bacteroides sp.]|uniref:Mfa1 family fimbria major subunit n=1 Tax=uncultured Bacteroides sp. TaxID=162156 RepID=UPI002593A3EC|nr:Mfa1 family fimbria major subunit [uncultured Bacteroides sp.]
MLKIKSILVSLLALGALASCSTNELEGEDTRTGADLDVAYMSLRITLPTQKASTRASKEEDPSEIESNINSLYVITFDEDQKLVHHSRKNPVIVLGSSDLSLQTSGNQGTTEAILVSASTKYLLVVVNPGTLLETRLKALAAGALYTDINMAIVNGLEDDSKPETLVGEIADIANKGRFTMINAGSYDVINDKWNQGCLLDVEANVVSVDGTTIKDEEAAKEAAEKVGKRATLKIERLAAKVEVAVKSPGLTVLPEGATFEFGGWTLDYYNSTFYPFAEKSKTKATHTANFYENSFYTTDPNFKTPDHKAGIVLNEVKNRAPFVTWKDESTTSTPVFEYCIENTMADADQKFGAATRVVIKGKYAPKDFTLGNDWFSFGGINYKTLIELQTAYNDADVLIKAKATALQQDGEDSYDVALAKAKLFYPVETLFMEACDNFLGAVNTALSASIATFAGLEQDTHLDNITDGGEIVKIAKCIKWYQKSLNYYYYEIRHDNTDDEYMYFGKYGVVRNNWYNLTLNKVNGSGTPWYPGGGPEDPEPEKPIDEKPGFLAFDIEIAPWVYWETGFEI